MRLLIVTIIIKKGRIITLLELDATLPLIYTFKIEVQF